MHENEKAERVYTRQKNISEKPMEGGTDPLISFG